MQKHQAIRCEDDDKMSTAVKFFTDTHYDGNECLIRDFQIDVRELLSHHVLYRFSPNGFRSLSDILNKYGYECDKTVRDSASCNCEHGYEKNNHEQRTTLRKQDLKIKRKQQVLSLHTDFSKKT